MRQAVASKRGLKVAFVAPSAYTLGGVQIWLEYLLPGLQKKGFDVTLILVNGQYHRADNYLNKYPFKHVEIASNLDGTAWGRVSELTNALTRADPDLVISVNIADAYFAAQAVRDASGKQIKVAMSIHGLEANYFADLSKVKGMLDAVIVSNRLTEQAVIGLSGFQPERVFYAPYGVALPLSVNNTIQKNHASKLKILYAGRVEHHQKRCLDLIDIARGLLSRNIDFELVIAGSGPLLPELSEMIERDSALNEAVRLLGSVEHGELTQRLMHESDILLITSSWETGPIVAWEAMAAGLVVVSSRYKGHVEEGALIHEQNCLLFDVGDIDSACIQIEKAGDPKVRSMLTEHAQRLVKTRYSITQSVELAAERLVSVMSLPAKAYQRVKFKDLYASQGRLDRLLGFAWASRLRRLFKAPAKVSSAGAEWPHAIENQHIADVDFHRTLDQALNINE